MTTKSHIRSQPNMVSAGASILVINTSPQRTNSQTQHCHTSITNNTRLWILLVENVPEILLVQGPVLYTDNWYTSVPLARHLFEKYGWLIVGTISPTDKKTREEYDIPFLQLSNGALSRIVCGWSRRATRSIKTKKNKKYHIQCTTWKDKKQVVFLHTDVVGSNGIGTTLRHVKKKRYRVEIGCPNIQKEYTEYMDAVDINDRDSAEYSISICTNCWYLRIFFWFWDRVLHMQYNIVCFLTRSGLKPEWRKYLSKHDGRRRFQVDLALSLMEYAIRLEWDKPFKMNYIPCECKVCFFCKVGMTSGITHKPSKGEPKVKHVIRCSGERGKMKQGYCKPCYRKQHQSYSTESAGASKKHCKYPSCGCITCKEHVCNDCWDGYNHKINKLAKKCAK